MHHHEKLTLSIYDSSELESDFLVKLREDITKEKNESNWVSFEIPFMLAFKDKNNSHFCSMEIEGKVAAYNLVYLLKPKAKERLQLQLIREQIYS
ncbi:hypothetical protein TNCV_1829001 [Trichonephila clavipes]|nr:hypothetical protein TNCV_1829001 [Trichonephila clavipes]